MLRRTQILTLFLVGCGAYEAPSSERGSIAPLDGDMERAGSRWDAQADPPPQSIGWSVDAIVPWVHPRGSGPGGAGRLNTSGPGGPGVCSYIKVGCDTIVTAGHCVSGNTGFTVNNDPEDPSANIAMAASAQVQVLGTGGSQPDLAFIKGFSGGAGPAGGGCLPGKPFRLPCTTGAPSPPPLGSGQNKSAGAGTGLPVEEGVFNGPVSVGGPVGPPNLCAQMGPTGSDGILEQGDSGGPRFSGSREGNGVNSFIGGGMQDGWTDLDCSPADTFLKDNEICFDCNDHPTGTGGSSCCYAMYDDCAGPDPDFPIWLTCKQYLNACLAGVF